MMGVFNNRRLVGFVENKDTSGRILSSRLHSFSIWFFLTVVLVLAQISPVFAEGNNKKPSNANNIKGYYALAKDLPADLKYHLKPLEQPGRYIGGCFPRYDSKNKSRSWGTATQGSAWDPYDNVYYTIMARKDGAEAMRIMTWGDSEDKRLFVTDSKWEFGRFPHQGLALYRPSKKAPIRFFAQANVHESKDRKIDANAFVLNLLEWHKEKKQMSVLASWKLFDEKSFLPCMMNVCISPDGKTIVCRARRISDKFWVFGVWKTATLLKAMKGDASHPVDASNLCERIFVSPWGKKNIALQSLATDGRLLYALNSPANLKPHEIFVMDLEGHKVLERRPSLEGFEIDSKFHKQCVEGEGLFFAKVKGKLHLVMDISNVVYDKQDENDMPSLKRTRRNDYYVLF